MSPSGRTPSWPSRSRWAPPSASLVVAAPTRTAPAAVPRPTSTGPPSRWPPRPTRRPRPAERCRAGALPGQRPRLRLAGLARHQGPDPVAARQELEGRRHHRHVRSQRRRHLRGRLALHRPDRSRQHHLRREPEEQEPVPGCLRPGGREATASGSTVTVTLASPSPFVLAAFANLPMVCDAGMKTAPPSRARPTAPVRTSSVRPYPATTTPTTFARATRGVRRARPRPRRACRPRSSSRSSRTRPPPPTS